MTAPGRKTTSAMNRSFVPLLLRPPCRAPASEEIALEPQAIVPPVIATPPDHRGGSIEAVSEQDHGLTRRQPAGDDREQLFLRREADCALGLFLLVAGFDFGCSVKYSVGRVDTRNPGARPSHRWKSDI